ncbi:DNA cytosine methyltransferase [Candidatus Blastococcus massiliensis]|uniref:DNA cytosine methyltransferase n=1 Tax=Candidatus Blastococcus massiliensis TaxID=1470358 RepID=UPI0004B4FE31|nr:DNA cytosine methyltransferase [Candidatus Blastococcus massiliensis]
MTDVRQSVELFAGGGGMALGMREAGFEHTSLVEWWKPAARVLRHNAERQPTLWKPDSVIENDVNQAVDELGERGTVQLVAGGPPCQPFSLAGTHAGDSDERNQFPSALRVVRKLRPELVVFENVPGLLRPTFEPYLDYVKDQLRRPDIKPLDSDELWDHHHERIRASKEKPTYRIYQEEVDAADLGVPQSRKRVFIIAIRADVAGAGTWDKISTTHSRDRLLHDQYVTGTYWQAHGLPMPTIPARLVRHVARLQLTGVDEKFERWRTLRDALRNVPEPMATDDDTEWPDHRAIPGARTYAKHTGSPMDMPSKTIKAGVHGVAGGEAMLRELDGSVRYLSVREAALVQGFPQDYQFPGPRSRVMGVIGNAVAVKVAATIGLALLEHTGL